MTARAIRFEVDLARFRIADQGVGWRRLAFGRRSLPTRSRNHAMNVFGNRDHVVIGNRQWWHTAFGASAADDRKDQLAMLIHQHGSRAQKVWPSGHTSAQVDTVTGHAIGCEQLLP